MSVLCLGEVWLELNAATAPELTETFRAQTGGWGAGVCRQYAALGGQAALLAQLGADPFGRKLAARLARDGVDCSLLCFTDAIPTPVLITGTSVQAAPVSPRRMIEPLPNSFSIWLIAIARLISLTTTLASFSANKCSFS